MRFLFVIITSFSLTACADTVQVTSFPAPLSDPALSAAHAAVAYQLYDPSSVQFREDRTYLLSNGNRAVCGQMNAKNQLGGYVGFTPYYVRLSVSGAKATVLRVDATDRATAPCYGLNAGSLGIGDQWPAE